MFWVFTLPVLLVISTGRSRCPQTGFVEGKSREFAPFMFCPFFPLVSQVFSDAETERVVLPPSTTVCWLGMETIAGACDAEHLPS